MKLWQRSTGLLTVLLGALLLVVTAVPTFAQESREESDDRTGNNNNSTGVTNPDITPTVPTDTNERREGRIVTSEEVEKALSEQVIAVRPDRPEVPELPDEVKKKLIDFQRMRERYLLEQHRLIKQYKGATDEERDKIRERIKARRERWLQHSRNIKETARDRIRDLIRTMPKYREALEAAREQREQVLDNRRRRGTD